MSSGITMVGEAGGELADDAGKLLGLAEQQAATVGGDVAAIERGEDLTGSEGGEIQIGRVGLGKNEPLRLRWGSLIDGLPTAIRHCSAVSLSSTLCVHRTATSVVV